ncbi:C39 family peptidase [Synechococcus sp. CBW1108]|jgi:hypothetical protein|uniref:C39 family peptidase n=1 Tax=Synechococcus sp. CBW1108 TaxID=1353147 RepID=UPI0018CE6647|nr:C39 family peptidase [Synechococcus sp. CBW1108]QPN69923.1 C39 family peptidase [Synechococcus sp. CBW1108]
MSTTPAVGTDSSPAAQAPFTAERWRQFWDNWKAQPQQLEGIEQLRLAVISADPEVLTEATPWRQTFSSAPPAPPAAAHANPLPVAWENQNDNASGTGYRECFSSSCAMLARYWGKVTGDDAYNVIRARYGDSTDAQAQLAALRSLGLTANFATNGDRSDLEEQINLGRPVAVGWLHHGSVSAPSGGGHWSVVIGFTEAVAIHNDPNGEADLVPGGYTSNTNGAGQHYSWKNWLPRWEADGPGTGWLLSCHP